LDADVRRSITGILRTASGEARAGGSKSSFDKDTGFVDNLVLLERLPAWLSPADLDHFLAQFERSGFRGPINWYRNLERNWALTPSWTGRRSCSRPFCDGLPGWRP
jgi:hypothetical protein